MAETSGGALTCDYRWFITPPPGLKARIKRWAAGEGVPISIPPPSTTSPPLTAYTSYLHSLLSFALTSRVLHLRLDPSPHSPSTLVLSLTVDPASSPLSLSLGPPGDDLPATSRWRSFYLSLSQLRRFRDGRIVEAVLWPDPPASSAPHPTGAAHLLDSIVRWTLSTHAATPSSSVRCLGWQLDPRPLSSNRPLPPPPTSRSPLPPPYPRHPSADRLRRSQRPPPAHPPPSPRLHRHTGRAPGVQGHGAVPAAADGRGAGWV